MSRRANGMAAQSSSKCYLFRLLILLSGGLLLIAIILAGYLPPLSLQSTALRLPDGFKVSPDTPFDPFVDIEFTLNSFDTKEQLHSSVQCASSVEYGGLTEADRAHKETMSRSCRYNNLFYRPSDRTFHYFPGPRENNLYALLSDAKNDSSDLVAEMKQKMIVSMDQSHPTGSADNRGVKFYSAAEWSPVIHLGEDPPELSSYSVASSRTKQDLVFTLYRTFYGFNLGHFIWDEVLPLFSLLDMFDLAGAQTRHVPLFVELPKNDEWYRCHPNFQPRFDDCIKMYRKWFPPLMNVLTDPVSGDILRTGNWLQGRDAIGMGLNNKYVCDNATIAKRSAKSEKTLALSGRHYNEIVHNTSWVVLPTVLAGIGRLNNFGCFGDCATGRSSQRYRFRNFILENILGSERFSELNNRTPRIYITFSLPGGSSRPSEVSFFKNFISAAKDRYGAHRIRVKDMARLSFKEQAELSMETAIFVSNHGGGSSTSIFLPKGASVFLYHTQKVKFDRRFFETLSYLQTVWVHPDDRNDTVKLMGMVEAALEATSGFYPIYDEPHN